MGRKEWLFRRHGWPKDTDYGFGALASWEHVFTSKGEHSLPCVEVESQEEFGYDGVLMDENHLLGLDRSEDSVSCRFLLFIGSYMLADFQQSELYSFDVFTF